MLSPLISAAESTWVAIYLASGWLGLVGAHDCIGVLPGFMWLKSVISGHQIEACSIYQAIQLQRG
jgi:hypothetical protein